MIELSDVGVLVLLGTWAALDGSSVGQILISRPMISSTLAGWVLGDPGSGLLLGMILEGAYLAEVPAGGARFPEPGPAGVAAALAFIRLGGSGGLAVGLALGVVMSFVGGASVVAQRYLNGILVRPLEGHLAAPREIAARHWTCIGSDAVRGVLVSGVGLAIALLVPQTVAAVWKLSMPVSVALFLMPALLTLGALLRSWAPGWARRALFAAGFAGGLVLMLVG